MAQTFSQGITGVDANGRYAVKTIQVGDTDIAGNALSISGRPREGMMMRGDQIQCKNPDGSLSWYTIDASRSGTGGQIVLLPVGP